MPRPRKPPELKAVDGTARKDRAHPQAKFRKVSAMPDPPEYVPIEGYALWEEIGDFLTNHNMLCSAYFVAAAEMCCLQATIIQHRRDGLLLPASYSNCLRAYINDFGMTPAHSTKVPLGKEPENPYAEYDSKP